MSAIDETYTVNKAILNNIAKGLNWQMMEIKEIWLAEASGSDFSGCLHAYTTQCGIELTSLPFISENESLNKTKLLLSVPFAE